MRFKLVFLFFIFYLLIISIYGQSKAIYGVIFYDNGFICKNQKKEFISFLKSIECAPVNGCIQDTNLHILCLENNLYKGKQIDGIYCVNQVFKKTDNFFVSNNKLKKKTIYIIDLYCVDKDSTLPSHIKLISFKQKSKKGKLVKRGENYQLSLFQIFGDDFTKPLSERSFSVGHGKKENCFYKNVFVKHLETGAIYYVESPNIKGLHYISPLKIPPKNQKNRIEYLDKD